jgi:hypothetical protein
MRELRAIWRVIAPVRGFSPVKMPTLHLIAALQE